jgi:RNA 3'-phosphate cyclase
VIHIDGSLGEGGGQVLRTSLGLAVHTGQAVHVASIRAGRAKPGLLRQHLCAVEAAAEICGGELEGAELGSTAITLVPGELKPGAYTFAVGSAGSATLVLQTVLPPLMLAKEPSRLKIDGGTHNMAAPPYPFLERAFAPALTRMGPSLELELVKWGFYPAGGGRIIAGIRPDSLRPLSLVERGAVERIRVFGVVSGLPDAIARREVVEICKALGLDRGDGRVIDVPDPQGPGNVVVDRGDLRPRDRGVHRLRREGRPRRGRRGARRRRGEGVARRRCARRGAPRRPIAPSDGARRRRRAAHRRAVFAHHDEHRGHSPIPGRADPRRPGWARVPDRGGLGCGLPGGPMDCGSCDSPVPRPDRPHTFLAHDLSVCPTCALVIEARVVVRGDEVVHLVHCKQCGPGEKIVATDAKAWLAGFLAQGVVPEGLQGDHKFKHTTSTCPTCLALVGADVVIRDGKVFFKKVCAKCGPSEALVSESAAYYVGAYAFAKAGTQPHKYSTEVKEGCPTDCGLCADHEQHTCLPIIEITDHCNLDCPVCIVNNQHSNHMSIEAFTAIIDGLVLREGQLESVALSGGEPTSHPRLLELIDIADRPEISRVVIITNGRRLGKDRKFAEELKKRGAYIGLQLDGFDAETHTAIRGMDLVAEKDAAIQVIKDLDLPTQVIFVATRGVNEHQIGRVIELFMATDQMISLNFQPMAYTGFGGGKFKADPMDRLTIPGVIQRADAQTNGKVKFKDFFPLPCSHPQCVSLTYLLKLDDGTCLPFPRFVDFNKHLNLLRSSAVLPATHDVEESLQDTIHHVFAHADDIPRSDEILKAMRRAIDVMFPGTPMTVKEAARVGERQAKSIFLHHYMDKHDFDLERLRKCCHHYPQTDGRVMPACGFNMFHRGAAAGPDTPRAKWGKGPWQPKTKPLPNMTTAAKTGSTPDAK